MSRRQTFLESMIVSLVMLFILLPVRLIFVTYVSDEWIGSFGAVSLVVFLLVYLSKTNRLGAFGRIFWRRITKVHKGKFRILTYSTIAFNVLFWSAMVFFVTSSDPMEVDRFMAALPGLQIEESEYFLSLHESTRDLDTLTDLDNIPIPPINIETVFEGLIAMIVLLLTDVDIVYLLFGVIDELFNGFFLHFATVFLVESLEVVGILIYTKWVTRNKAINNNGTIKNHE